MRLAHLFQGEIPTFIRRNRSRAIDKPAPGCLFAAACGVDVGPFLRGQVGSAAGDPVVAGLGVALKKRKIRRGAEENAFKAQKRCPSFRASSSSWNSPPKGRSKYCSKNCPGSKRSRGNSGAFRVFCGRFCRGGLCVPRSGGGGALNAGRARFGARRIVLCAVGFALLDGVGLRRAFKSAAGS
jgi:hypothetical protein